MKIIKLLSIFSILINSSLLSYCQELPIDWEITSTFNKKDSILFIKYNAKLKKGWHIYTRTELDSIPFITRIELDTSTNYKIISKVSAIGDSVFYSPLFNSLIGIFTEFALYTQRVKLLHLDIPRIKCQIQFQVCSDKIAKCFYRKQDIEIPIISR